MRIRWQMFLDDERFPVSGDWIIARTFNDAALLCLRLGCPTFISFDHDLGGPWTGKDFVNWLVEKDMDSHQSFIPREFQFKVHSANPEGAKNIHLYLYQYLTQRFGGFQ